MGIFTNIFNYFSKLKEETKMTKLKYAILFLVLLIIGAALQYYVLSPLVTKNSANSAAYTLSSDKDEVFYSPATQRILLYNKEKESAYSISLQDVDVFYSATSGNLTASTGKVLFYDIKNGAVKQILSDDLTKAIFSIKASETNKDFSGVAEQTAPQKAGKSSKLPKEKVTQ